MLDRAAFSEIDDFDRTLTDNDSMDLSATISTPLTEVPISSSDHALICHTPSLPTPGSMTSLSHLLGGHNVTPSTGEIPSLARSQSVQVLPSSTGGVGVVGNGVAGGNVKEGLNDRKRTPDRRYVI